MTTSLGIIDLHVHAFPERMFKAVWNSFRSYDWGFHEEYVPQIIKTLSAHGVVRAATLSYPHTVGVAESLNLFMEELGRTSPIFLPFASVYPDDDNFRQVVDYALDSPHLYGFKFQPLVQRFDVNDPRLDYFYQGCLEREAPIIMHIGSGPMANEFVGPGFFRRLMRRFPELRICVPHMGMTEYEEFLLMMDDHPNMFFDTAVINITDDRMDTTYPVDPERLMRHADRVCFGSDWPFTHWDYQTAIDSVARFGFGPDDYRKVMRENALRFLKLEPEQGARA